MSFQLRYVIYLSCFLGHLSCHSCCVALGMHLSTDTCSGMQADRYVLRQTRNRPLHTYVYIDALHKSGQ